MDPRWKQARNILIIRLDNLGDVLLSTPAIHAVRQNLPEARITLLASPVGAQIAPLNEDIDAALVYQAPWMDVWQELPLDPAREWQLIDTLRRQQFDAAIIFTSFRQSSLPAAYLCYLAEIPLRLASSIDGSGSLLTTRHKHQERLIHEVARMLELVATEGFQTSSKDLVLQPSTNNVEAIQAILQGMELSLDKPYVVIHPGCSMPARTYPWPQYAEAADLLIETLGVELVFTGVSGEKELVRSIQNQMRNRSFSLAGQTELPELAALISLSSLLITNNTGPAHVAAAVKTRVVSLFALTNPPEQWAPWQVPHRILNHPVTCAICYSRVCPRDHACLRLVTAKQIVDAAIELLIVTQRERNSCRHTWANT